MADERKFTEYLFNAEHPAGMHKARALRLRLGYDVSTWREFRQVLLDKLPYAPGRFMRINLANPPGENWKQSSASRVPPAQPMW